QWLRRFLRESGRESGANARNGLRLRALIHRIWLRTSSGSSPSRESPRQAGSTRPSRPASPPASRPASRARRQPPRRTAPRAPASGPPNQVHASSSHPFPDVDVAIGYGISEAGRSGDLEAFGERIAVVDED